MLRASLRALVAAILVAALALATGAETPPGRPQPSQVSQPGVPAQPQVAVIPQDSLAADSTAARHASALDSAAKAAPKSRSDTVIVVKHHFNHREQIITGSVIMTCLALMMVTMNNYNPR